MGHDADRVRGHWHYGVSTEVKANIDGGLIQFRYFGYTFGEARRALFLNLLRPLS